jgi:NTP pyrophosphatase (non-canonical NTP hydrolase)
MTTELTSERPSILECAPANLQVLDDYQTMVGAQASYDENGVTIQDYPPEIYMYLGLLEELSETIERDRRSPDYHRFRAVLGDFVQLQPVAEEKFPLVMSEEAIALHHKEFGDVSWYLANFLSLHGITMSEAVAAGEVGVNDDRNNHPKCDEEFSVYVERVFPLATYAAYWKELVDAATDVLKAENPENTTQLRCVAGKFILSMAHMLQSELGTTYEEVLQGNIAKIQKRLADGTVFDKTGGDVR